jgi:hypothetical protein
MTAITFPTDPANDELYTAPNGTVYIWDGEKWVVNSTIYTGPALENLSQDRVAPMFVNGVNTGITFAYDSTTNTLTSTVTGGGISIGDFGEGFSLTDDDKVVTNKLFSSDITQPTQRYRLELTTTGVVVLPDQSIINGATLKTVAGNYAGITAGPQGSDEDSWVWVDNDGATISTKYSTDNNQWKFNNDGGLTFPDATVQTTAWTGVVATIGDTAPTLVNGALWFNSEEARTYVRYNNQWVDASPTVLPLPVDVNKLVNGENTVTLDENDFLQFSTGGAVGNVQQTLSPSDNTDLPGIDLYADNTMAWAQLNYNNANYVWVNENGAYLDTSTNRLKFDNDGILTLDSLGKSKFTIGEVNDGDSVIWVDPGPDTEYLGLWYAGETDLNGNYGPRVSVNIGYVIDDGDYTPEHQDHQPETDLVNINVAGANWNFRDDGMITLPNGGVIGPTNLTEGTGVVIATHPTRYYTFYTAYFETGNGSVTTGNARYFSCGVQVTTNGEYIITDYNPGNSWVVGHQLTIDGADLEGVSGTHDLIITVTGVNQLVASAITSISVSGRGVGRTVLFGPDGTINNAVIDGGVASTWLLPV